MPARRAVFISATVVYAATGRSVPPTRPDVTASRRPLVLVPSRLERDRLVAILAGHRGPSTVPSPRLVGVGPAAAGAVAADLIRRLTPPSVILVGLAGTFDPVGLPVGRAFRFERVRLVGVGAGGGGVSLSLAEMGLEPAYPGERPAEPSPGLDAGLGEEVPGGASPSVADVPTDLPETLDLSDGAAPDAVAADVPSAGGVLLTVCQASLDAVEAGRRRAAHPDAVAEEMETWSVAAACRLAGVPLTVVRGISNEVGDRAVARWAITPALTAIADVLARVGGP